MSARTFAVAAITTVFTTALAAAPAAAQTEVVDEGTFRLSVRGTPVGTETFTIRRSGSGDAATYVAQGRLVLDSGEQTRALLQLEGPELRPSAYQIEVTGPQKQSIRGQAAGNRFRAQIVSTAGEMMREYIASDGAVVLDEGIAHQYYFLVPAVEGQTQVPVIIPRESRQVTARVSPAGTETITIAGQSIRARRIEVQPTGTSARTIWVDDQGRILRLSIPADNYRADRTTLP